MAFSLNLFIYVNFKNYYESIVTVGTKGGFSDTNRPLQVVY